MKRTLLAGLLASLSSVASASIFDLNINDDSFRIAVGGQLSKMFDVSKGQFDLGVLSKRGDDNSGDLTQGHFGILLTGDAGAKQADVVAGLGKDGASFWLTTTMFISTVSFFGSNSPPLPSSVTCVRPTIHSQGASWRMSK